MTDSVGGGGRGRRFRVLATLIEGAQPDRPDIQVPPLQFWSPMGTPPSFQAVKTDTPPSNSRPPPQIPTPPSPPPPPLPPLWLATGADELAHAVALGLQPSGLRCRRPISDELALCEDLDAAAEET